MYITINNRKGKSRIDLSYSIQNFDSDKEITVIRMLSDNVKYEILKVRAVMQLSIFAMTIPPAHPRGFALKTLPHSGAFAS